MLPFKERIIMKNQINVDIIGAHTITCKNIINTNIHVTGDHIQLEKISFDIEFDCKFMKFMGTQIIKDNVEIKKSENNLHVEFHPKELLINECSNYKKTRILKLNWFVNEVKENQNTAFNVKNIQIKSNNDIECNTHHLNVCILASNPFDYNHDGVIGIGDVVLAPYEMKKEVAQKSKIYPYKRVLAFTIDAAGNAWDEQHAHYDPIRGNKGLENVRKNPYLMKLHNEEFATSFSARSITPPISAQNYSSMFTGVEWCHLPDEYKATNESFAMHYWPDYKKEKPLYPTIFDEILKQASNRSVSIFSEWDALVDGMIEPDKACYGQFVKNVFEETTDFIDKYPNLYKKNAFLFMQSDEMDHYGHCEGFFTDGFYEKLQSYDKKVQSLIETLKKHDLYEDTLILSNSDHGGHTEHFYHQNREWGGGHGIPELDIDMDVYISVGGQTVNSGTKLQGGINHDIAAIVMDALRLDKSESMKDSHVFDSNMFLSQEQLISKNRNIEKITLDSKTNVITLSNCMHEIKAIDCILKLNHNEILEIETSGTIIRQDIVDDTCALTIYFEHTPSVVAKIKCDNYNIKMKEAMLGTSNGKEIYCDIVNK